MQEQEIITTTPHKRIDTFLCSFLHLPKNQILQLIKNSLVLLNGSPCAKGGKELKIGDRINILAPTSRPKILESKTSLEIDTIYEDDHLLILNKPSDLVIHPAPSQKAETLLDWLKAKGYTLSTISGEERCGIVHRLDKDTTGAIAIAKNNLAHNSLANQLQTRTMGRYYLAIIDQPIKEALSIHCHMGRNPKNRLKMCKLDPLVFPQARESKSLFLPLFLSHNHSYQLVAIKLFTGRTHQIRVHLESISRHILGDGLYGYRGNFSKRIMLHAFLLYLIHPSTQKNMLFRAPVFQDMLEFLEKNFDKEQVYGFLQNPEILLTL
ncbi:RluA family pseudouridine synthase [Helicobacter mustelae]|uniref:Pseudouridine synthase n=1 Tax=Helicobacter mustelae (strain ATCC 43772 / CCUG 25715 / CIP 103759 / LMG 18044 / NCTC 12198 / R85-136P) TaxID=679897 RepID=D3UGN2_HELM1|nr:RluA family pseudouridine synthase [Helicobacter mustelae]CBG39653.1 putative ribosomal pseudouridine synthase [Helicobacter mustelae 12198]SQH71164.1 ribosomal pseudouridine synthase [Helicobacter mustelae]